MNNIMNTYSRKDLNFETGNGAYLYTIEGEKYLDFVSGVAVNILGHNNEIIVNAIKKQSEKLIHVSNLYYTDNLIKLSEMLCEKSGKSSVFFSNSGAESVETALKIAKKYGNQKGKSKILYMNNSFHGRTLGALSVTGQTKYQKSFAPLIEGASITEFNDIDSLNLNFTSDVCAVIIESIQGEGGIISIDLDFAKQVQKLCIDNDALLIVDEIQSGIYRTGKLFSYEHFNLDPDVICVAKGLGGGLPIGATIVSEKADVLSPGDHGSTFGGNPLVTGVACAILSHVSDDKFLSENATIADSINSYLLKKESEYSFIKEIKGKGMLIGIDIDGDLKEFVNIAQSNNLLLIGAGSKTIRLLPPLNLKKNELDDFYIKFDTILKTFENILNN
ncbi:MAG: acetylornithine/succinylornithine family transaminase [Acidaminobacteraceae bacterium]